MSSAFLEGIYISFFCLDQEFLSATFCFLLFQVEFPENYWLPENMFSKLEALLPKRDEVMLTDDMEEVDLSEVDYESQRKHSREAYEEDEGPRSHGVQCQTQ